MNINSSMYQNCQCKVLKKKMEYSTTFQKIVKKKKTQKKKLFVNQLTIMNNLVRIWKYWTIVVSVTVFKIVYTKIMV